MAGYIKFLIALILTNYGGEDYLISVARKTIFGILPEPPAIARPASAAVLSRTTPPSRARPVPIEAPAVKISYL